jgi:hypothetical protein
VKPLPLIVPLVKLTESKKPQIVSVHPVMLILMMSVLLVTGIVKNVLKLLETVLLVPKTELKPQPVSVQMVLTKFLIKLIVQLVLNNVTNVLPPPITVPLVLPEESTHQNVSSHHQKLLLLKSLMSQSVPPKSLTVPTNVKPVPKSPTIVPLVMSTDLTHQPVTVSVVSTPTQLTNLVSLVTSDVLHVLPSLTMNILNVTNVLVTEPSLQTVHVMLVLMKMPTPTMLTV